MTRGRTKKGPGGVAKVPSILQMEAVECGAASLAMVLAYYGAWIPLAKLRMECGVTRDGSNAGQLAKVARTYGLQAKGRRLDLETLRKESSRPLILFWGFGHFVVFEGMHGDRYQINDPAGGRRLVGEDEFSKSFTGIAVEFDLGPDFKPVGSSPSLLRGVKAWMKGNRIAATFAVLCGLFLAIPGAIIPGFTGAFIDRVVDGGNSSSGAWLITGMILMLAITLGVTLLQGNDFHLENVIANGSMPVPIDLETISVPTAKIDPDDELDQIIDPARELVSTSVLGTLLLPSAMAIGKQRDLRQLGALRVEIPGKSKTRKIRKLSMVNTDFQRWVSTDDDSNERPNSEPWIEGGDKVDASDYLDETKRGYRVFYEAMGSHRQEIAEGFSVLEDAWVRVLNRATNVYFRLLLESCNATLMKSGVDRWIHLQRLGLSLQGEATKEGKETLSHLVGAEVESLFEGDIAYFSARGGGIDYAVTDPVTGGYLKLDGVTLGKSARQRAEEQLARMSPEDLEIQIRFQGDAYRSTLTSLSRLLHGSSDSSPLADELPESFVQEDEVSLEKRVVTGLDLLLDQRIQKGNMTNWIGLDIDSVREIINPTALSADFYSGRGGITVLLEKAYRVLGDRRYLDVACSAIEFEVANHRRFGDKAGFLETAPDGFGLWGGLTAACWVIGRHEGMGGYRDLALEMVKGLSENNIRKDERYDIISGSAGAMLLILSMNNEDEIPGVHEIIGRLADHLVRNQVEDEGPGWPMFQGDRAICGFGHGRSGPALALLEAGKALGRKDLLDLALAAFHGEHGLRRDNGDQGWPDLRGVRMGSTEKLVYGSHVWCNGLEGIALSRAAALDVIDDPILRDDLEFSLQSINRATQVSRHHLCCGRAGRVVTLDSLRRLVPEAGIIDPMAVIPTMAQSIDTVDNEVVFGLHGPGLLQGHAGAIWAGLSILDDQHSDLLLLRI